MGSESGEERRTAGVPGDEWLPYGASLRGAFTPTPREAATILSMPTVLVLFYVLVQPTVDAWRRFGYVRYAVARTAPPHRIAPEPFTEHAWWWHELTRLTHALIHDPSGTHTHVIGNTILILTAAWLLLGLLALLDQRRLFPFAYWEVVVVAPLVGSFSFDLFGTTAYGYGASTVGFAFLGIIITASLFVLATHGWRWLDARIGSLRLVRSNESHPIGPRVVVCVLLVVVGIVVADIAGGSPAMPVHQAGVGFGALVGAVLVPAFDRLPITAE